MQTQATKQQPKRTQNHELVGRQVSAPWAGTVVYVTRDGWAGVRDAAVKRVDEVQLSQLVVG